MSKIRKKFAIFDKIMYLCTELCDDEKINWGDLTSDF